MKEMKKSIMAASLLYVLIGIILVIFPKLPIDLIVYVVAALVAIAGIVQVITFFTKAISDTSNNGIFAGMILIFIAAFACWKVELIESLLPLVLGFIIVISGILSLQDTVNTIRIRSKAWIALLLTSLVKLALGAFIILYPFDALELVIRLVGIGFIISGVSDFIITNFVTNKIKDFVSKKTVVHTVEVDATIVEE